MKQLILLAIVCSAVFASAQDHPCAKHKQQFAEAFVNARKAQTVSAYISHDQKYDMKFVHLDLNLAANTKYISGNVKAVATVTAATLDTFMVLLHKVLVVDSVYINGSSRLFIRQDSMLKVKTAAPLTNGSTFTAQVWYKGTPPTGGAAIGSGFSSGKEWNFNQDVTWSLSQPFVAYHWWPCKQELTDKIDSSWVFITTDTSNMAGSNGLLSQVVDLGAKKRYEWKSRYPIDYYLISVAVSDYKEYNVYAKPQYLLNDSILIQNFMYAPSLSSNFFNNAEKPQIQKIPAMIELFSNLYGMYPFYKEKYGHCLVPIGGGMEHQTMTSQGFMHIFWLNVHELAHQWFGNSVTCKSWSDIWINEGFASYSEHVANEYLQPQSFATHLNAAHTAVMGQAGGSCYFTGDDTLKTSRIFDSRLTYDKGGAIIHTLRFETNNDSLWFSTLRDFQYAYKYSTASVKDFMSFYHTKTGIDPTRFFDQWFYGEGYPIFDVKWNSFNDTLVLQNRQIPSKPDVTPLFITPVEYRMIRPGKSDTVVRLLHDETIENYTLHIPGAVGAVQVDPRNWIINQVLATKYDPALGIEERLAHQPFHAIVARPNPTSGVFILDNPLALGGTFVLRDLLGRETLSGALHTSQQVDLSQWQAGIYILTVYDKEGKARLSRKIVKE